MNNLFDTENYAQTFGEKIKRSLQLGPKYYLFDIPKYYFFRKKIGLNFFDYRALVIPLKEIIRREYHNFEVPDKYDEALKLFEDASITFALPELRLKAVACLWWKTRNIPGDVIEFGAYRGATSLFLALLGRLNSINQKVFMLDTFEGMPESSKFDTNRKGGEYLPQINQVDIINENAKKIGVLDRIFILKGLFKDSINMIKENKNEFAFCHIDANIYSSTYEACDFSIPRMNKGGGIVFDDYNALCDLGARLAIDKYLKGFIKPTPLSSTSAFIII